MNAPGRFRCRKCNHEHDLDEVSFGSDAPDQWRLLSAAERSASVLTPDQCVLNADGAVHHFVRACLDLPIRGGGSYTWGVWVSLSAASFSDMEAHWDDPARVGRPPYFGWLCTALPEYPSTLFLKTWVHQRPPGQRPLVELEPTDHALAVQQRTGVERDWLMALVQRLLHPAE